MAEESRVGPRGMWKHEVSLPFGAVVQDCAWVRLKPAVLGVSHRVAEQRDCPGQLRTCDPAARA